MTTSSAGTGTSAPPRRTSTSTRTWAMSASTACPAVCSSQWPSAALAAMIARMISPSPGRRAPSRGSWPPPGSTRSGGELGEQQPQPPVRMCHLGRGRGEKPAPGPRPKCARICRLCPLGRRSQRSHPPSLRLDAAHGDQRQVEVSDLGEQAVQGRLVGDRPGDGGLAARDAGQPVSIGWRLASLSQPAWSAIRWQRASAPRAVLAPELGLLR
jgi:hypothetical protein